ncbi:MAG TPA: AAA family ATPase [Mycobacteriales bacterium]|nr:AAA family ATPase [Mycobacteriales bacterium]
MGTPPGPAEPEFVGRQKELATLGAALDRARRGQASFAIIVGAAGIGKTWLVTKATGSTSQNDLLVLRGGCVYIPGIDVQSPYGPFMEALRHTPEGIEGAVAARAHQWLQPRRRTSAHLAEERRAEFLGILGKIAEHRTVVLVLEDLHWADKSSLGLLVFLARNLTTERVLVIATARPGDDDGIEEGSCEAVLEHLRRLLGRQWLSLSRLPEEDTASLVRACGVSDQQVVEDIVRLSDGSPLTAREMAEGCSSGVGVADSTRSAVRGRMRDVTPTVRQVVGVSAVVGMEVSWRMLSDLMVRSGELGSVDLDQALLAATAHRLLVADGQVYSFRHALERKAVYEKMAPGERARWHARVAGCLEEVAAKADDIPAERWAEIAAHWALTDDDAAMAASSLRAGLAAQAVSAFPEALAHLENGRRSWRRLLPQDPPGWKGRWLEVALAAAACARWTGKPARGLKILEDEVSAVTGGDAALLWDRIGRFRREIGDGDGALGAYQTALSVLREDQSASTFAQVCAGYAALLMTTFQLTEARKQCEAALDAAGSERSPARANALNTLGVVEVLTGNPARGLELLEESHKLATFIGSGEDIWRYVGNMTFVLQNLDRTHDAVGFALEWLDRARATRVHRSAAVLPSLINAVSAMVLLGRWSEALELVTEALQGDPTSGQAASLHMTAAEIHALRGDREAAAAALAAAREGASPAREPELLGHICRIQAESMAWSGDIPGARKAVDEGLRVLPADDPDSRLQLSSVGLRVEADAAILQSTRSPQRVTELEHVASEAAARLGPSKELGQAAGATLILMSEAEAARSHRRDTPAMWQQIASGWDEAGRPYQAAYARLRQAETCLRSASTREAATELLDAAAATATKLGSTPLSNAVAARRGELYPAPGQEREPAAVTKYGLTLREVEVLRLLVATRPSNASIAKKLKVAERTVTTHLTHIYDKLGVAGRTAAIEAVHNMRLLEPEDG